MKSCNEMMTMSARALSAPHRSATASGQPSVHSTLSSLRREQVSRQLSDVSQREGHVARASPTLSETRQVASTRSPQSRVEDAQVRRLTTSARGRASTSPTMRPPPTSQSPLRKSSSPAPKGHPLLSRNNNLPATASPKQDSVRSARGASPKPQLPSSRGSSTTSATRKLSPATRGASPSSRALSEGSASFRFTSPRPVLVALRPSEARVPFSTPRGIADGIHKMPNSGVSMRSTSPRTCSEGGRCSPLSSVPKANYSTVKREAVWQGNSNPARGRSPVQLSSSSSVTDLSPKASTPTRRSGSPLMSSAKYVAGCSSTLTQFYQSLQRAHIAALLATTPTNDLEMMLLSRFCTSVSERNAIFDYLRITYGAQLSFPASPLSKSGITTPVASAPCVRRFLRQMELEAVEIFAQECIASCNATVQHFEDTLPPDAFGVQIPREAKQHLSRGTIKTFLLTKHKLPEPTACGLSIELTPIIVQKMMAQAAATSATSKS